MGTVEQAYPESIDEILSAVKETARGRWFLENYEKRLRSSEGERILDSIAKLERHIQRLSGTSQNDELLHRARDAIAATRRDLAGLGPKSTELTVEVPLSTEGQLFAKLAMLSKLSFNGPSEVSKGVEHVLRLVSDLDQQRAPTAEGAHELKSAQATDFFKPDAAVFEPAQKPSATITPARPLSMEAVARGARLVIAYKPAPPEASEAKAEVPASTQTPEEAPILPAPQLPAQTAPDTETAQVQHSRIVIIRRKASDLNHLPLLDPEPPQDHTPPPT